MGGVAKFLLSPVLSVAGSVLKPKAPQVQAMPLARPEVTPRTTALLDAVAARRGSRANQRTGRGGAEAGGKTKLGA